MPRRPARKPVQLARNPEPFPYGVDPYALADPDLWDEVVSIFRNLPASCRPDLLRGLRHVSATPERERVRLVEEIAEAFDEEELAPAAPAFRVA